MKRVTRVVNIRNRLYTLVFKRDTSLHNQRYLVTFKRGDLVLGTLHILKLSPLSGFHKDGCCYVAQFARVSVPPGYGKEAQDAYEQAILRLDEVLVQWETQHRFRSK